MTVHPTHAAFVQEGVAWMAFCPDGMTWSPGTFRLLGLPEQGFAPNLDLFMSFVPAEDRSIRQDLLDLADGRRLDRISFRLVPRTGPDRFVTAVQLEVVEASQERRLCLLDLTDDRHRSREVVRASDLLSTILRCSGEGIVLFRADGIVERANAPAARILGSGPLEGICLWDRFPGLSADPIGRLALDGDGGTAEDERWIPALGRWLSYGLARSHEGCIFVFRDRDEVAGLKASLVETSERWASAVSAAGAAMFEADTEEGRIWFTGEPGSGADPVRVDVSQRIGAADRHRLIAALRSAEGDGRSVVLDIRMADREGERIWRLRAMPVGSRSARRRRVTGLALEISRWAEQPDQGPAGCADLRHPPVTGGQVRAARGALRWSVRELAEQSDVSVATINRFEACSRTILARDRSVSALEAILTERGIVFFRHGDRPALAFDPASVA